MTTASRLAAAVHLLAVGGALGQCTDQWLPGPGVPGVDREPNAMIVFDFDGPGPRQPELVVGGYSIEAAGSVRSGCIAIWNGTSWHPLNGNASWVAAFTTWDPDGPGPEAVRLIASGGFDGVNGVAYWAGDTWQLIGQPAELPLSVSALTTYDPDGPGSAPPSLIAAGSSGYASGRVIVQWDGAHWVALGGPFASPNAPEILALTTFDPDDTGPALPELIVGGHFSSAGGVAANGIAAWNGSTWRPLDPSVGPATMASVYALMTWDPDGAGPLPSRLIAVGGVSAPSSGSWPVASWDGSAWSPVGVSTQYALVRAVSTFDPDGVGPAQNLLIAFGSFSALGGVSARCIASWDGSEWRPLGEGVPAFVGNTPVSLATFDPDGAGSQAGQLVAAGRFTEAGDIGAVNIASWNGTAWSSLGGGFNQAIEAMSIFDPDGVGPAPAELYAGGRFIQTPDGPARGLARWDGARWHAVSPELSAPYDVRVLALALWDPDGAGPSPELLIVVGWFSSAGSLPANGIVAWDGASWRSVGDPAMQVTAVTSWDPDGPGPITPRLVAAGYYNYGQVKQWDGATWQQLGGAIYPELNSGFALTSLAAHDPDGPGAAAPELFLGGTFYSVGASIIKAIARWDGTTWVSVFSNIVGGCAAMRTFDLDGPGPLPERLAVVGELSLDNTWVRLLVRTGTTWSGFPAPDFQPRSISPFDPDGPGPRPTRLVIGGYTPYLTPTGYYPNILWWDDGGFEPFNPGVRGFFYPGPSVAALAVWEPSGELPRLAAGGFFNSAGDHVSNAFAIWSCATAGACYPNCDGSTAPPILNISDFICFMNRFAAGDPYANCDASTNPPILNVQDFICFSNAFLSGCP